MRRSGRPCVKKRSTHIFSNLQKAEEEEAAVEWGESPQCLPRMIPARLHLPKQCLELEPKGSNLSPWVTFLIRPTTEDSYRKATVLGMDL